MSGISRWWSRFGWRGVIETVVVFAIGVAIVAALLP